MKHKMENSSKRLVLFGGSWFMLGLLPIILFPNHVFSYYLPISLVGLLLVITVLLDLYTPGVPLRHLLIFLLIVNWLVASFTTINFNSKIHWIPRRAKISKTLVDRAKQLYPAPSPGQVIFVSPSSENKLALNGQDGLRVVYNNDTILTVYGFVIDRESL